MKPLHYLTVILIALNCFHFSCSTESKAKKAIKENLRLTLHDFKSYEPVQFGKIEVAMSSYADLPEVKRYLDMAEVFLETSQKFNDEAEIYGSEFSRDSYLRYRKMSSNALDSASAYMKKIDSIKLHFVPQPIGWKMKHTFRAKNLGGNFGITNYEFYFNDATSTVIKAVDLSEE